MTHDVSIFLKDIKKLFFELYDKYGKYYDSSSKIKERNSFHLKFQPFKLIRSINYYFKKYKNYEVPPPHYQHQTRSSSSKLI